MQRRYASYAFLFAVLAATACSDAARVIAPQPQFSTNPSDQPPTSVLWNARTSALIVQRATPMGNAPRIFTYLSYAQYKAVLEAEPRGGVDGLPLPSVEAAVGAASVAVLSFFFPLDAAALEAQLDADLAAEHDRGPINHNDPAGEAIGRTIGAATIVLAQTDGVGSVSPGAPPTGPGFWSSATATARGHFGARPFFLDSPDQFRAPPPPAFGSPAYLAALAEVRSISDTRTSEQRAIAIEWHKGPAPYGIGYLNEVARGLLTNHPSTEREAARVLALSNAAVYDVLIACFETKFAYWYIRPSQADPAITLPIGLPNHPSYASAHSCVNGAFTTVLRDAFPSQRSELDRIAAISALSRVYAGIHYRFDVEAGLQIGRDVGQLALSKGLR